jgi:hypothetical protein
MRPNWRSAAVLATAVILAGCGDDGNKAVETQTVRRFCELSQQLEQAAVGAGAAPTPGSFGGSPEALGRLLAQMGPTLEEMKDSAPKEVRGDTSTLVDALEKAGAGDAEALGAAKVGEATGKINAYRARSCTGAATSGDG